LEEARGGAGGADGGDEGGGGGGGGGEEVGGDVYGWDCEGRWGRGRRGERWG
jgi:hypothetical protein